MLLKNKTIRYKVLFNIMKKINLSYKERNLLFIFTVLHIFFYFEQDLFGEIPVLNLKKNSLFWSNYIMYVCLNETTTNKQNPSQENLLNNLF